jgi:hypothetical protein
MKSAANVSNAHSKVKAFLKAGKQIMHTSVIELVIRPKTAKDTRHNDETTDEPKLLRRFPHKQVLQRQENIDADDNYKPDPMPKQTQSGTMKN